MAIADRAAAFLGKIGAAIPQSVTTAAGQFLGNVGTATGAVLSGTPATFIYPAGKVLIGAKAINPGGLLNAVGMRDAAAKLQAAYQNPRTAQMIGAGTLGTGVLGVGAVAGLAAMQHKRYQERMAGQNLGTQLGVAMPPVA